MPRILCDVRLSKLSFRYGRRGPWVLREVDAAIEPGEIVVVEGRNGAGKSTLLQIAVGVLRPVGGRVVDRPGRVGWVPERFPAEQPFTVAGYLDRVASMIGGSVDPRPWIERLGLSPFVGVRLGELSKGTAQKVGLAQALLVPPDLLVLDEPWEGLDAAARDLVPQLVAEVVAGGGAVLVSDHRGETARLPGTSRWRVEGGVVAVCPGDEARTGDPVEAGGGARADEVGGDAAAGGAPVAAPVGGHDAGSPSAGSPLAAPWLIEVAARDGAAAVAALRSAGHEIIRVSRRGDPPGSVPATAVGASPVDGTAS